MADGGAISADKYADAIGRRREQYDVIAPRMVDQLAATLDRLDPPARPGDPLPPMWEWVFFTPSAPRRLIDRDGHPMRGDFLPPVELPRRMFAGASYRYHFPLRVGDTVTRVEEIEDVAVKQGQSGTLVFVTVKHSFMTESGLAQEETQNIVYRDDPKPGAGASTPKPDPETRKLAWHDTVEPDPVMLFRYSALTFNGHRIHYDRTYANEVEGYPGLVVHGPLIALCLVELLRRNCPSAELSGFRFRARRPLFDTAPFSVVGGPREEGGAWLSALTPDGDIAMEAAAEFAQSNGKRA